MLVEKEDALKEVTYEKLRLEADAEGFNQRLRALDESEQRYKDENWTLETQIHEFLAAAKEAADKEKRLTQTLNIIQAEKSSAQKELDEIKLSHAKLSEEHAATLKQHDAELGSVKRNITMAENERGALQRKVEELTGQNQELAKAVTYQRGRLEDHDQARGMSDADFETAADNVTPEHSPPPSPIKGTPRHSMLESETLKSSLHHAHRMIQNLKGNIHREKTEKLELKRMLQDTRDELENRRNDSGLGSGKRSRKVDSREFKKPPKPGQLGGLRASRSEVFIDDMNWEEDNGQGSPTTTMARTPALPGAFVTTDSSDHFDTANEGTDAFETANERGTETEDFQTGHEEVSGSDELTETEGQPSTLRGRPAPLALTKPGNRNSFQSTASTSGDEYSYEDLKTPTAQTQRLRLKVNRNSNSNNRRMRLPSEEPRFQEGSPASFANSSQNGTPQAGQSLFAELGDMSDEDESMQGTPSRSPFVSLSATPASRPSTAKGTPAPLPISLPPVPKIPMVDSGIMTEPWEPEPVTPQTAVPIAAEAIISPEAELPPVSKAPMVDSSMSTDPWEPEIPVQESKLPMIAGAAAVGGAISEASHLITDKDTPPKQKVSTSDAASQWHQEIDDSFLAVESQKYPRPISTSTYSDMSSQYDPEKMEEKLAKFPSPPISRSHTPMASITAPEAVTFPLTLSTIHSEHVEPESPIVPTSPKQVFVSSPEPAPVPSPLTFSHISAIDTEPSDPILPQTLERDMVVAPQHEGGIPVQEKRPETPKSTLLGAVFSGWNKKGPATPVIAEDETRQSPSDSPIEQQTPDSQRPFKELSGNTNERLPKKQFNETIDESSQTALTAEQIDKMLDSQRRAAIAAHEASKNPQSPSRGMAGTTPSLRTRKSQESFNSVRRITTKSPDFESVHDSFPLKRPTSAGSARNNSMTSVHPPLPTDHKQVIAAAAQRTGSSSGTAQGSMGPPPLPVSGHKPNTSFRPRTPSSQAPLSPLATGPTPRAGQSVSYNNELHSPSLTGRSRRSSVTSFASEVETRFNLRPGMMPNGIDPGTDPRMINAITQTMIGEYLWKYTRKAGRGTMSENRHRRYFWVHPYTRTLYWSDRDPSQAGRAELKAKSVPIEAVRVVTDDNPMPPGLHRKSLVIITPGRSVKFTATTGQRHETWFNALSYLLLRTGEEDSADASEVTNGGLTREDVDEFNPSFGGSSANPPRASLSSYNSRTTRNDSIAGGRTSRLSVQQSQPQLTQSKSTTTRPTMGTLSRLSSYWASGKESGRMSSFSSRHSRNSLNGREGIYEASEVHDSAEDLREIIEKQDRESDRLENVRACCDGRFLYFHQFSSKH